MFSCIIFLRAWSCKGLTIYDTTLHQLWNALPETFITSPSRNSFCIGQVFTSQCMPGAFFILPCIFSKINTCMHISNNELMYKSKLISDDINCVYIFSPLSSKAERGEVHSYTPRLSITRIAVTDYLTISWLKWKRNHHQNEYFLS